ncbi:MAG: polyprenyl synthetase family protein, partial [Chloroflexi bacterium]|nr:polyprenyl synthetase family protein [Chloroflexota bacterium]
MDKLIAALDAALREIVTAPDPAYEKYYGMFRYHLGWVNENFAPTQADTGKHFRALLALLSCQAVSGDWKNALPLAAAIELAHNFSLIHDDIEDASDARRGRATVWKVWGLAQGLNAGDGMFVVARRALHRLSANGIGAEKLVQILKEFDHMTLALCQGQFLDISFETRLDVSVADYLQMIRGKTAALVSAATKLGARVGTNAERVIDAFAQFGENIGLAFQISDDILGMWGDPEITGKPAWTDIFAKKKSLPALIALNDARHGAALRAIYAKPALDATDAVRVLEILDALNARAHAQNRADEFRVAAEDALN